jgi:GTP-binding protein
VVLCVLDATSEPLSADREAVQAAAPRAEARAVRRQQVRLAQAHRRSATPVRARHRQFIPVARCTAAASATSRSSWSAAAAAQADRGDGYETAPHIAIIGRPNAGKSSLVNQLLGEDRQLVDARPGTTVDSIDTLLEKRKGAYVLIDNRRHPAQVAQEGEHRAAGILQAVRAIERCDMVLLMVDAPRASAEQDAKIAGMARRPRARA